VAEVEAECPVDKTALGHPVLARGLSGHLISGIISIGLKQKGKSTPPQR